MTHLAGARHICLQAAFPEAKKRDLGTKFENIVWGFPRPNSSTPDRLVALSWAQSAAKASESTDEVASWVRRGRESPLSAKDEISKFCHFASKSARIWTPALASRSSSHASAEASHDGYVSI